MKYDLLIFDLDGTLVDSQKDLATAVNLVRKDYALPPLSLDTIRSYVGNGLKVLIEKAAPELKNEELDKALEKLEVYYEQHLTDETKPYEGVCEMLEAFKNNKKAILTNKPEKFTKQIIKHFGWDDKFIEIFGGDSIEGIKKPNPKIMFELLKRAKTEPQKAIMIGDGINDVKIAKEAKTASLAVLYGFTDTETLKSLNADFTAQKPIDIVDLLS